ncbi:MAG: hypothetical protein H6R18_2171, partial [Proteobacteria bacterium]|nr:hypothetical protein [Pseudomonadota bacterium]
MSAITAILNNIAEHSMPAVASQTRL